MSRINNILYGIGWKTRRWTLSFELLQIKLGQSEEFGIRCFTIHRQFRKHSLFSLIIEFPNRTTKQRVVVDEWDILWSRNAMWKWYDRTTDNLMWTRRQPTGWERLCIKILDKIF